MVLAKPLFSRATALRLLTNMITYDLRLSPLLNSGRHRKAPRSRFWAFFISSRFISCPRTPINRSENLGCTAYAGLLYRDRKTCCREEDVICETHLAGRNQKSGPACSTVVLYINIRSS